MLRIMLAVMAILAFLSPPSFAADTLDQGLRVRDSIPQPFAAVDQHGVARDFPSLGGKKGLILLFTRSLDW